MDSRSQTNGKVTGLSTSEVAALIALGIFVIQLLLSFVWPLIVVGFISERETAVTWSVVSRTIHNSYWPTVLQTDATAASGVKRRVSSVTYSAVLGAILVGIAGIVTPLGLYEGIFPADDMTPVRFEYAPDSSGLGTGTPARHDSLGFSRICSDGLDTDDCPHSYQDQPARSNDTGFISDDYDKRIPKNTYDFFQSGTSRLGRTVSSFFDIEYRAYEAINKPNNSTEDSTPYLVGGYKHLENVLLNDDISVVEGLVVDTKSGGVGFRNHTMPAENLEYGGEWEEDILFIEPVTECVNTNITLRFSITNALGGESVKDVVLVDQGGFVDLNQDFPMERNTSAQENPDLAYRAYQGAWVNNAWTMLYLNVTNPSNESTGEEPFSYVESEKGKKFLLPINERTNSTTLDVRAISVGPYLQALNLPFRNDNGSLSYFRDLSPLPSNPWEVSSGNISDLMNICDGSSLGDRSKFGTVIGACGLVEGIPQRTDSSDSVLAESGSEWETPVHSCASASRAIIKTVSFSSNSTGLSGLQVTGLVEKEYSSDSDYPIWAVEDVDRKQMAFSPLWGLAESEEAPFSNIAFKRHPHLWLHGGGAFIVSTAGGDDSQNLPAAWFHGMALGTAYSVGRATSNDKYSGAESQPLYNRYKDLTKTADGTAKLINLIWTDVATNAVVGTHSQVSQGDPPGLGPAYDVDGAENRKRAYTEDEDTHVPIRMFHRRVKYQIPYAIPAFILLASVLVTLGFGFVALVFRGATPRRICAFLTRLSAGRIMTATLLPEDGGKGDQPTTKAWLDRKGRVLVDISGGEPRIDKGADPGKGHDPGSSMLEGERNGGQ